MQPLGPGAAAQQRTRAPSSNSDSYLDIELDSEIEHERMLNPPPAGSASSWSSPAAPWQSVSRAYNNIDVNTDVGRDMDGDAKRAVEVKTPNTSSWSNRRPSLQGDAGQHADDALQVSSMSYFRSDRRLELRYRLLVLLTAGVWWVVGQWFRKRMIHWRYRRVNTAAEAEYVQVEAAHNGFDFVSDEELSWTEVCRSGAEVRCVREAQWCDVADSLQYYIMIQVRVEQIRASSSLDEQYNNPRCFGLLPPPLSVAIQETRDLFASEDAKGPNDIALTEAPGSSKRNVPLSSRMIIFRNTRFVFDEVTRSFERIGHLSRVMVGTLSERLTRGLSSNEHVRPPSVFAGGWWFGADV